MVSSAGMPRARSLAALLRDARTQADIPARQVARQLGMSHTTIQRWEAAEVVPNAEDVAAYLACIGIVGDERERILSLARSTDESDWLVLGTPGISVQLAGVMDCERAARRITEWAPLGIPGIMQTSDYARNIITIGDSHLPRTEVDNRVRLRLARRDAIFRREPVEFIALVGEPAIRSRVGGPDLMAHQLRQVLDTVQRENVTLQVVSVTDEWHAGNMGSFILYEFEEGLPSIVYLEHYRSGAFLVEKVDVSAYIGAVEMIRRAAMSAEQSAALIADVISTLERTL